MRAERAKPSFIRLQGLPHKSLNLVPKQRLQTHIGRVLTIGEVDMSCRVLAADRSEFWFCVCCRPIEVDSPAQRLHNRISCFSARHGAVGMGNALQGLEVRVLYATLPGARRLGPEKGPSALQTILRWLVEALHATSSAVEVRIWEGGERWTVSGLGKVCIYTRVSVYHLV